MDAKSLATPPSILFPVAGAIAGYLVSSKSAWGAVAGALAGALLNASAASVQTKLALAKASGKTEFQGSLAGELAASVIGSKAETPKGGKQVAAGALYLNRPVQPSRK